MRQILDVCCGSRMFYFDKNDPRVVFCDIRKVKTKLCDGRDFEVNPDVLCDFTKLPFKDNSFWQVVFDPPHLVNTTYEHPTGYQQIKYGALRDNWREVISKGFVECWRVLKPNGTLIFKWNETNIKVSEILGLLPIAPVFGHRSGKRSNTHWMCFFKEEVE